MPGRPALLISCEHGGRRIPPPYRSLFAGHDALLRSHRGHDPGALALAREMAAAFGAPLIQSTVSRLLVDLNRSPGHPRLYSPMTRGLPAAARREVFARYYLPYRARIEAYVARVIENGERLVHIASHSFTPVLDGEVRHADVGLLYDPWRPGEVALCRGWQRAIEARAPAWKVRRNYPYTGSSDGLTAYLRKRFGPAQYVGVELEVNQKYVFARGRAWRALRETLIETLGDAL
ncbi:N-formylglutamate amidohydrolase [Thiobacillus denitrificans]|nr:N-formylglutamate amidohydrolase [Thiobacillus denitrificans]